MFVQIRAVKRDGFQGVWRAGRFWPSHEALRVQVVDEDPTPVKEDILDSTGKKVGAREVPDMGKISKRMLDDLKKDGRVSVFADGEAEPGGGAELEAAHKEIASLKATIEAQNERIAELEGGAAGAESESHSKHGKHKK